MNDDLRGRGRWRWKAMPYGKHTACAACGTMAYCYGRTRERMICLACFSADESSAKLRRAGKLGTRTGYEYRTRRPRYRMIDAVVDLHDEGLVVMAIADKLGLAENTVRTYLSESRRAEK